MGARTQVFSSPLIPSTTTNHPSSIIHHHNSRKKKKNLGAALLSRVLLLLSSASLSLLFSLAINSININAENGGSAGQANTKKTASQKSQTQL